MANITADNEKSTIIFFFLTNSGDSFCNSYIYHLVGLHIRQWQSDSNTTSSLKNNKTIWDKFIICTHTLLDAREGLGILLVFAKVQYGFLTVCSNICHGQFSVKEVFLRHPVASKCRPNFSFKISTKPYSVKLTN